MNRVILIMALTLNLAVRAWGAAPDNDDFQNATLLQGDSVSDQEHNIFATVQNGEPAASGFRTLWWSYRPGTSGRLTISTLGSDEFSTALAVYLGTNLTRLRLVASPLYSNNTRSLQIPVTAGADYKISVGSADPVSSGRILLNLSLDTQGDISNLNIHQPATLDNDAFARRVPLAGTSPSAIAYNLSATSEPTSVEPAFSGYRTLWWSFRPSANGRLLISTAGSDEFYSVLAVYLGTNINGLRLVAKPESGQSQKSIQIPVTAGAEYEISVGSADPGSAGSIVLNLALDTQADVSNLNIPQPATMGNDNFAMRMPLQGASVSAILYNTSATGEPTPVEPNPSGYKTLWWSYRPPANGRLTIRIDENRNFPAVVSAYLGGNPASLRLISTTSSSPVLGFPVTANTEYQISVGTSSFNETGSGVLSLSLDTQSDVSSLNIPSPVGANDSFLNRIFLDGATVSAVGYNTSATREQLEPIDPTTYERTVWWSWTAPGAGEAVLDLTGSDLAQKIVTVWRGQSLPTLKQVAASTASGSPRVTFTASAGETYQIAVGNTVAGEPGGSIVLTILEPSGSPGGALPNLTAQRAVRLRWFAENGVRYQVQQSSDARSWTNVGDPILGVGAMKEFFDTAANPQALYRIFLQP